jgi:hypothetical protein
LVLSNLFYTIATRNFRNFGFHLLTAKQLVPNPKKYWKWSKSDIYMAKWTQQEMTVHVPREIVAESSRRGLKPRALLPKR